MPPSTSRCRRPSWSARVSPARRHSAAGRRGGSSPKPRSTGSPRPGGRQPPERVGTSCSARPRATPCCGPWAGPSSAARSRPSTTTLLSTLSPTSKTRRPLPAPPRTWLANGSASGSRPPASSQPPSTTATAEPAIPFCTPTSSSPTPPADPTAHGPRSTLMVSTPMPWPPTASTRRPSAISPSAGSASRHTRWSTDGPTRRACPDPSSSTSRSAAPTSRRSWPASDRSRHPHARQPLSPPVKPSNPRMDSTCTSGGESRQPRSGSDRPRWPRASTSRPVRPSTAGRSRSSSTTSVARAASPRRPRPSPGPTSWPRWRPASVAPSAARSWPRWPASSVPASERCTSPSPDRGTGALAS